MSEVVCWIKKRSVVSFLLVALVIGIILTFVGIQESIGGYIMTGYLIVHLFIVYFSKNDECEQMAVDAEFKHLRRYKEKIDEFNK